MVNVKVKTNCIKQNNFIALQKYDGMRMKNNTWMMPIMQQTHENYFFSILSLAIYTIMNQ